MTKFKIRSATILVLLIVSSSFAFQNCSKNKFTTASSSSGSSSNPSILDEGGGPGGGGTINPSSGGGGDSGSGPQLPYTETCDDFETHGYTSLNDCLTDGRWHLVYANTGTTVTRGSANFLHDLVLRGVDVKVLLPTQNISVGGTVALSNANGSEHCQQVYRSSLGNQPIYCLVSARFSGEATPADIMHGSARYGSDGSLYCKSLPHAGNGCSVDPVSYKWYVRF